MFSKLNFLIKYLQQNKKNNYEHLLNSKLLQDDLINLIKSNTLVTAYVKHIVNRTENYSKFKKWDVTRKSFPICLLLNYEGCDLQAEFFGCFDKEKNKETILNKWFWNAECLNGILKVLRIILKEQKDLLSNSLPPLSS